MSLSRHQTTSLCHAPRGAGRQASTALSKQHRQRVLSQCHGAWRDSLQACKDPLPGRGAPRAHAEQCREEEAAQGLVRM